MSDNLDKEYDLLYENIRKTNIYNAKYREFFRAFFGKQPEDNIDYINLILDINALKKNVGEFWDKLHAAEKSKKHKNNTIISLNNDLDTYWKLIMEASEYLGIIVEKTARKLNNMERYGYFDYKKDLNRLTILESKRAKLETTLTDITVTSKNKRLYKPTKDI